MSELKAQRIEFGSFVVDVPGRQLWRDGRRVSLSPRYFDALVLLARNPGRVVSRRQLLDDVWGDTVVGDEALSQCITTLRRALGDDAANPRYIRTAPRRGYEFIASAGNAPAEPGGRFVVGATLGGALAGAFGGLLYGGGLSFGQTGADVSAILAVMITVNVGIGALAALGTGAGFAVAGSLRGGDPARIAGAALGGLAVGATVQWFAAEAFVILFGLGMVPGTGAAEGLIIGAAIGAGLVAGRGSALARVAICGVSVALAAVLVVALGGHLMAGSLAMLAGEVGDSPLSFDHFGRLVGANGFVLPVRLLLAAVEGGALGSGIAFGVLRAREWRAPVRSGTYSSLSP